MNAQRAHLTAVRLELSERILAQRLGLSGRVPVKTELEPSVLERLCRHSGEGRRGWLCFRSVLVLFGLDNAQERELLRNLQAEGRVWTSYYERAEPEEDETDPEPIANALARHLHLLWLAGRVDDLLDDADVLLDRLRRGRLHYRSRRLRRLVSRVLRMERELTSAGSLSSRVVPLRQREAEQRWAQRFELESRQAAVSEKLATLNGIVRAYMALGDAGNERRLIGFEVVLLAFFPLFALGNVAHWNWMDWAARWLDDVLRLFR